MKLRYQSILLAICASGVLHAATLEKADWHTFGKAANGFTLQYPNSVKMQTSFSKGYLLRPTWSAMSNNASNNAAEHSVLELQLQDIKGSSYFYRSLLRVGVSTDAKDMAVCEKTTVDGKETPAPEVVVINEEKFFKSTFSDAAMGKFLNGTSYRRLYNNKCYSIDYLQTGSNDQKAIPNFLKMSNADQALATEIIDTFTFINNSKINLPPLTDKGIGKLTAETPFDVKAVKSALPGLDVKPSSDKTEGESFETMIVSKNGETLLTLLPTKEGARKVICIAYKSSKLTNAFGVKKGDTYADIYKNGVKGQCLPGLEEMSGQVICKAPNAENIYYVFEGKSDSVDGEVPPLGIVQNYKVVQVIWLPDSSKVQMLATYCRVPL